MDFVGRWSWTPLFLAALAIPSSSAAEEPPLSVHATLSETTALEGDLVSLEIKVVARANGALEIQLPEIPGLTEVSRSKSEGTSISWSGGAQAISREHTVAIEYQVDRSGTIRIPPIEAHLGPHRASSAPLEIAISAAGQPGEQGLATRAGETVPPLPAEGPLFARYRASRASAYLGQEILLDLEIFVQPGVNFTVEETSPPPELDGFWREMIEQPQRLTQRTERVAGQKVHVYRVWRVALFAIEAGDRTIPATEVTFGQGRSIFGSGRRIRRRAPPLEIGVLPLPSEGRPADFNNANVGEYRLLASVDHAKVPAGKAVLLTLAVEGRGNVKSVRLPEVAEIDGFRVFPPSIKDELSVGERGVSGRKVAEILLLPARGGRLQIPSFSMTVFDPIEARYRRLDTETIRVLVEGEPVAGDGVVVSALPEPARAKKALDLLPLRYRSRVEAPEPPPWQDARFFIALATPPALFSLGVLAELILAALRRETHGSRRRAAARAARARLKAARRVAGEGAIDQAYGHFASALYDFGSEKCGLALRGLTSDQIARELLARGAPESLTARITEELEAADYARFAPGTLEGTEARVLLARWQEIMAGLETFEPREIER